MLSVAPAVPLALALALCADIAALALGWPLPRWLRRLRAGKSVSQYQPAAHQAKTGTPSMAGLLFIGVTVVCGGALIAPAHPEVWWLLALMVAAGALGLIDDLSSSLRFMRGGIRARTKFAGLVLIAAIMVAVAQVTLGLHSIR